MKFHIRAVFVYKACIFDNNCAGVIKLITTPPYMNSLISCISLNAILFAVVSKLLSA